VEKIFFEWRNVLYTAVYEKNLLRDGFGVVWEIVFSKDFYRFRETGQGVRCPSEQSNSARPASRVILPPTAAIASLRDEIHAPSAHKDDLRFKECRLQIQPKSGTSGLPRSEPQPKFRRSVPSAQIFLLHFSPVSGII
jgi:hypothetical protein